MTFHTHEYNTPFLNEHKRMPTAKQDGIEVWLKEQIAYLESIDRTTAFGGRMSVSL